MKSLRDGRLIIETGSKEEIDILSKQIEEQCGQQMEVNIPKRRNPNIVIYNIPDELTKENAIETIQAQTLNIH